MRGFCPRLLGTCIFVGPIHPTRMPTNPSRANPRSITSFREIPVKDLPMLEVLRQTSERVFVPLTIGYVMRARTFLDVTAPRSPLSKCLRHMRALSGRERS